MFCDKVSIIHDVIITANLYDYIENWGIFTPHLLHESKNQMLKDKFTKRIQKRDKLNFELKYEDDIYFCGTRQCYLCNDNRLILTQQCSIFFTLVSTSLHEFFIFQLRESPCNIAHDISFLIYNGYF